MPKAVIRSELLALLNQRKAWEGKPYIHPLYGPETQRRIQEAVRCVGLLEASDPFAGARVSNYLQRGYCLPSEVLKECREQTLRRSKEPKGGYKGDETLAVVKARAAEKQRKKDADKAWNQHNSQQFLADKAAA